MFKWLRQNTTSLAPIEEKNDFDYNSKIKEKIVMEDLIADNYVLLTKIGHGAFGDIILSYNLLENCEVIVKKELKTKNQRKSPLHNEYIAYQNLLDLPTNKDLTGVKPISQEYIQGLPKFFGFGEKPDYYYLIMDFLGPNLTQLLNFCGKKKFTLGTVCLIAMQMLNRIEYIHRRHYLHRDIKPENFCIGSEENTNIIFLIDFGLAKRFKDNKTNQHIPYREGRPFIGTARYVSINCHLGVEQSRRDDLSSIGYVLVYLLKGSLPWQGLKGSDKMTRIVEKKVQIPNEVLCAGLPNEFVHYLNYCKNLKYEERPDYKFLKGLFGRLLGLVITSFNLRRNEIIFDWCFDDVEIIWNKYFNKDDLKNKKSTEKSEDDDKENVQEEESNNVKGIIESLLEESSSVSEEKKESGLMSSYNNNNSFTLSKKNLQKIMSFQDEKNQNSKDKDRSSCFKDNSGINGNDDDNSSVETVKEEFNTKKICTDIKEIKSEQKLNEKVDKKIFEIVGKPLEDYIVSSVDDIDDKRGEIIEEVDEYDETLMPNEVPNLENNDKNNDTNIDKNNDTSIDKNNDTNISQSNNQNNDKINIQNRGRASVLVKKYTNFNSKGLTKEFSIDERFKRHKLSIEKILGKTKTKGQSKNIGHIGKTISPLSPSDLKFTSLMHLKDTNTRLSLEQSMISNGGRERIYDKSFLDKVRLRKENLIKIQKENFTKDYEIIGDLGSGSYGSVKKVRHKKLKEIRAMKIILKKMDNSKTEIDIMRKISHPNIVNIFDIYEDSKKYYIMMEICEGGELFEAISEQGAFTEQDCAYILRQILSAVSYLHSKNIMHRDIKPENIMLTKKINKKNNRYEIKLIDFGTAKIFKKGKKETKFIGTSYYIAPEVLKENYDEKCDVWSCGVIMYILLCGYPPFNGNSNVDIYNSIQNSQPYFHGEDWKDITPEAIDLLQNMLNKKPQKRYSAQNCLDHRWFNLLEAKKAAVNQFGKKLQMKVINKMNDFVKENRLKQAVLQFISNQFNLKKEEEDLQTLFKEFDLKKTGEISKEIFYAKLTELYGEIEGKEICDKIFERLDLDGSGEISYDEFLSAMIDGKKVLTEDRLEKAFKMFDKDGNGLLSIAEIVEVFGGDEAYWRRIIEEVDSNSDGEVDFNEFKMLMGVFKEEEKKGYKI